MPKPSVLGLIPARGGSKGIPRKNIKNLYGKPLIAWTIDAALNARCLDAVVVSTEDEEIAQISTECGATVPFMRPKELAQDKSLRNEVVLHALREMPKYDYVVLLQPTSPLRQSLHIDEAFQLMLERKAQTCVSVVEQHPSPYWMFVADERERLRPLLQQPVQTNRQGLPKVYALNGAIYIGKTNLLQSLLTPDPFITSETAMYEMLAKYSWDIDDDWDWAVVESMIASGL